MEKACLYACAMVYGFDAKSKEKLKDDFFRRDFKCVDGETVRTFTYAATISSDTVGVFVHSDAIIIAYRGTQGGSPERFLGIPAEYSLTRHQRNELTEEDRINLLATGCPSSAAVGCNREVLGTRIVYNTRLNTTVATSAQANVAFRGGVATDVVLEQSSDCLADLHIVQQQEHTSKLHKYATIALHNLLQGISKRTVPVYVTGHSLGGSLAAFATWQMVKSYPELAARITKVVLYTAGAGLGSSASAALWAVNGCSAVDGLTKQDIASAVLRAAQQVVPAPLAKAFDPMPRDMLEWKTAGVNIVQIREACDVVSFPSTLSPNWYPTVSFYLKGSSLTNFLGYVTRGYALEKCVPGAKNHGLSSYMSDEQFWNITRKFNLHKEPGLERMRKTSYYLTEEDREVIKIDSG